MCSVTLHRLAVHPRDCLQKLHCSQLLSAVEYLSHSRNSLPCKSRYFLRCSLFILFSEMSRMVRLTVSASWCSTVVSRYNGMLGLPRTLSRVCHPSQSLFFRTVWPNTDQLAVGQMVLLIQVFSMYVVSCSSLSLPVAF